MPAAPFPADEPARLQTLLALDVLDSAPEAEFDALVQAAAALCGTPVALLSLVDEHRIWLKARAGLPDVFEVPRAVGPCAHTILQDTLLEVPDTTLDPRFADSPVVTGVPGVRFYAGVPLRIEGRNVGALCVVDLQPNALSPLQREALGHLATAAAHALEGRRALLAERGLREQAAHAVHACKRQEEALQRSEALLQRTGALAGVGGWEIDLATGRLTRTEQLRKMCGEPPGGCDSLDQALGLYAPEARPRLRAAVDHALATGEGWDLELPMERGGGDRLWVRCVGQVEYANGRPVRLVGAAQDVTSMHRIRVELDHRATHDALTGLVNRAEFETRLQRLLHQSQADGQGHALLYIDLDQFKLVNDACGHAAGDQLLQQVAQLLGQALRTRDTLARLGGDEFAVILEHCSDVQALRVAREVCERMNEFRFVSGGQRFRIGASIGLVPVDRRWATVGAVMQAADTSCYAAKENGRNRVHLWLDSDEALRARHGEMQLATRLEQALDENRFVLHAQRIVPVNTPAQAPKLHAELLVRLRERDGTLVSPGAFLPAAERFHLASRIDRWVLARGIELLRAQGDLSGIDMLSINLSGQSVGDRAFHRDAIALLSAAGPALCRCLCLEITETAAVTNMAEATRFITQAHALGIRIALDDFGAGASSFGYLKSLAIDQLKIDGQFVRNLLDDALDDATVRCFQNVARVVGVKTVAEFVDRPEVLERLREIGVDCAQGFLLHRPEPAAQLLRSAGADNSGQVAMAS
ncbi:putative bifunctional diguanylate cyclase/phosphodiesterase [Azohydromonas aeria]|uniref:putative bifunctional diguanylate cyclase/phosphodiesterase n=1 Tax=Azohydromonas aeria TaxID=2590212 RepID=UPI0012F9F95C|nr:EAL domain-containing protein [Azohydromonas aeria]